MRLPRWLSRKATLESADTRNPKLATWVGNPPTYSGKMVSSDTAMRQTTWLTCLRILAETVSGLPGAVYERQSNGNSIKVDHDLGAVLFATPNADMDKVEFHDMGITNLAGQGNMYCYRNVSGKTITSLYPIPAASVEPRHNPTTYEIEFGVTDRGKIEYLPRDRIWQVKGFGANELRGLSPIGYQRELIGMALATEEWQARFFSQGLQPSTWFSIPQFLKKDQREILQARLEAAAGAASAYKAFLLEGGATIEPNTMPLKDAQFLELRQATRQDIFGFHRIPPHMGGDLSRSTNNNIEQQALEFVMYAIMPYLIRLEASANRWLLTPQERRKYFVRYNVEGLLRADSAARAALYAVLVANGIMTRNEVRALENLNRSDEPGMDTFTVQTANAPIGMLQAIAARAAAPAAPPALTTSPKAALDAVQNFTIGLPDAVKHSFAHELPGVLEMLEEMRASNKNNNVSAFELRECIANLADRLRETNALSQDGLKKIEAQVAQLGEAQWADREAVVDGMKITTRAVRPH